MLSKWISRILACIKYHIVGLTKIIQLFIAWADQHIMHKQSMIGTCGNYSNFNLVISIPSSKTVNYINSALRVQVINCPAPCDHERICIHADINIAPPYIFFDAWMFNDSFIFGAASGFFIRRNN